MPPMHKGTPDFGHGNGKRLASFAAGGVGGIRTTRLVIEYVPADSLVLNDYNPNQHDAETFDVLLRSVAECGLISPIIVHLETGKIIDGEHRWRCAQILGIPEVPIVRVSMTPAQAMVTTIRCNTARGTHTPQSEADVLAALERETGDGYRVSLGLKGATGKDTKNAH